MKDQKKAGLILSYMNLALGMVMNFILLPIMITAFSDETYSLYKVIQSIAGPLAMFNLGLSGIATRCIAKFNASAEKNKDAKENSLAMVLLVAAVMAVAVLLAGICLVWLIPYLYRDAYSADLLVVARQLMAVFTLSAAVNIFVDIFRGCVAGNEYFAYQSGVALFHTAFRLLVTLLGIWAGMQILGIAMITLVDNVLTLLLLMGHTLGKQRERFHLISWNKQEFRVMLSFSGAILLQTFINQVNNNMDIAILGTMVTNKTVITMYSAALTIYAVYNSILSVVSGFFFPKTVRMIEEGSSAEELTELVIKTGRFQTTIAVGIIFAFSLFGRDFVSLWIGEEYKAAHLVALVLLIPVTIPLVQNACLNILDAQMKRMFRSVVLAIMAVLNLLISILAIPVIGFWGAALGTCLSLIIGHGFVMNLYYKKRIGLNIRRMFREMFRGVLPCGVCAAALSLPATRYTGDSIVSFAGGCLLFCGIYGIFLWNMGWNEDEKCMIKQMIRR